MTNHPAKHSGTRPAGLDSPSAFETVRAVKSGNLTAKAALELSLDAIERENGTLNAVVLMDVGGAQKAAEELDRRRADGLDNGPLDGLPMTIKEAFHMEGLPTSWGIPEYQDNVQSTDSVVARRLRQAGAVLVGKTNLPQGMEDWETDNENYGSTKNPWNNALSAGGSSGGGAAAVASGMLAADIGSDTGGSLQIPAHFCGIYGIKPTYNLTSVEGHTLGTDIRNQDMNTAGPLCRTPEDIDLILSAIAGPGEFDQPGWSLNLKRFDDRPLSSLRVAALLNHQSCPVDGAYLDVLHTYIEKLRSLGVTVDEGVYPDLNFDHATKIFNKLVRSEGSTRLSDEQFREVSELANAPGELTGREFLARLNAQGRTLSHRDWLRLHEDRLQIRRVWGQFFMNYDTLLCPVSSTAAPPLIESSTILERTIVVNGENMPMLKQHLWSSMAVLPYLPALTVPIGQTEAGLPVGINWLGPAFSDLQLTGMAAAVAVHLHRG